MPSLCLCMIVRDEVDRIEQCLDSVKDLIDYWVICDTGSLDATAAVIARELEGIPGELHHHEWEDFGHNRTRLMELAYGKADYLILLDADSPLEAQAEAFANLTADAYYVTFAGSTEHKNKRVVSGRIHWRYEGVTHEYITSPEEQTTEDLPGVVIRPGPSAGGARTGRWHLDRELLTGQVERDPADARAVFYLAQTYRDLGEQRQAAELYERRGGMGGWVEESYCAYLNAGVLRAEMDQWPAALMLLIAAWELRPARLEALYEITSRLRMRGQYESAHAFALRGQNRSAPPDLLFVQPWVYRWGMLFEYSITAYWVGETKAARRACTQLLALPDLPENYRAQTLQNRGFCDRRLALKARDNVVPSRSSSTRSRAKR